MSDLKQNPGYVDQDYLVMLAKIAEQLKREAYDLMQIAEGHTVLDVGCGPATDTIAIGEIVGPSGRVVGFDHDPEMVELANQKARDAGMADYVIHEHGDASQLPYEDNTFDSSHTERVLQHVTNPEQLIAEMVRVTKPNGIVYNADPDYGTLGMDSHHFDIERRLMSAYPKRSANYTSGRRLYQQMKAAQLELLTVKLIPFEFRDYKFFADVVTLDRTVKAGLEHEIITQEEWETIDAEMRERDENGMFFGLILGCVVVGKKSS